MDTIKLKIPFEELVYAYPFNLVAQYALDKWKEENPEEEISPNFTAGQLRRFIVHQEVEQNILPLNIHRTPSFNKILCVEGAGIVASFCFGIALGKLFIYGVNTIEKCREYAYDK